MYMESEMYDQIFVEWLTWSKSLPLRYDKWLDEVRIIIAEGEELTILR